MSTDLALSGHYIGPTWARIANQRLDLHLLQYILVIREVATWRPNAPQVLNESQITVPDLICKRQIGAKYMDNTQLSGLLIHFSALPVHVLGVFIEYYNIFFSNLTFSSFIWGKSFGWRRIVCRHISQWIKCNRSICCQQWVSTTNSQRLFSDHPVRIWLFLVRINVLIFDFSN